MTPEFWAIIGVGVAVLAVGATVVGSHFSLHRDMADLRERMAKLEGAMDGWTKAVDRPHPARSATSLISRRVAPATC